MKRIFGLSRVILLLVFTISLAPVGADAPDGRYFSVSTATLADARPLDRIIINGPPEPPPGFERSVSQLPQPSVAEGVNVLSNVPAFNWSFGCSATSAAMIAGYYDRTGYANMYAGPTNGGLMPLNNSSWPDWFDGTDTRHQCPLSATHAGLDGRSALNRGHVDDYWIVYGNGGPDPFIVNGWTEHTYGDCTGDYMKTNQSTYGNVDAGTTFYNFTNGTPLYWHQMEGYDIDSIDGGYGLKLFFESRGYTVTNMYNQYILGYASTTAGFTYDQYKAEIDAGRPVMFHVEGHTMVGIGYDDSTNLMYIHDTWDYSSHTMTWGGSYSGMAHYGVTIVELATVSTPPDAPSDLIATAAGNDQIDLNWSDNSTNEAGFGIERSPDGSAWAEIDTVAANVTSYSDTGLAAGTTYHYRVHAYNGGGNSSTSNEASATTADDPPTIIIADPADGATVSGSITIVADANDDIGVVQVEFTVDGGSIGVDSNAGDGWSVFWDTTLVDDGSHSVSATATDTAVQTGSASISITVTNHDITPPAPPSNLAAVAGNSVVDLSWSADTETDLAGYTVYRATTTGGPYSALTASLLTAPSYADNSVSNCTPYLYVVTASDASDNESVYSGELSATPQAGSSEDVATADYATTDGTVAGTYLATQSQDDGYQSITEEHSGGKPSERHDRLEHIWTFDVTDGNHMLHVDAYYDDAGDADAGFAFYWATDPDGPWSPPLTVVKTDDNDSYDFVDLGSASGTIYVRVTDDNRDSGNNNNDTLRVDHIYIDGGVPVTEPPEPPSVTIAISNTTAVQLSWPQVTVDVHGFPITVGKYWVHRSTEPHSAPITPTWTLVAPFTEPVVHLDADQVGDPTNSYYTVVAVARNRVCLDLPSEVSNRSGEFDFSLVPGS